MHLHKVYELATGTSLASGKIPRDNWHAQTPESQTLQLNADLFGSLIPNTNENFRSATHMRDPFHPRPAFLSQLLRLPRGLDGQMV
jgi:hypothetical protein